MDTLQPKVNSGKYIAMKIAKSPSVFIRKSRTWFLPPIVPANKGSDTVGEPSMALFLRPKSHFVLAESVSHVFHLAPLLPAKVVTMPRPSMNALAA